MAENETVTNYYETLPKKFKEEERTYPSYPKVKIKLPFRMCVTGASGSGKTNMVINLIQKIHAFDKIMIWAKTTDEPLYASFIDDIRQVEKKTGASILTVSNDINDLPNPKTISKEHNTILIIDDMVTEKDKALKNVMEYYTFGRKQNVSSVFLSQSYFDIPTIIRKQTNYYVFTKIAGERDLGTILKDFRLGVTEEQLVQIYNKATAGGFPNFFMIDIQTNDVDLRFRRNFQGIKPPENTAAEVMMHKGLGKGKRFSAQPSAAEERRRKKEAEDNTILKPHGTEAPKVSYEKEEPAYVSHRGKLKEYEDTRMQVDASGNPMEEEDWRHEMDTGEGIGRKRKPKKKSPSRKKRAKKETEIDKELWALIEGLKKKK